METKFTKGEWNVGNFNKKLVGVDNPNCYYIADCGGDRDIPSEEAEANAKLIAASPDLLTAIVQLVDRIETNWEWICSGTQNGVKTALLHEAKEAIKKATE